MSTEPERRESKGAEGMLQRCKERWPERMMGRWRASEHRLDGEFQEREKNEWLRDGIEQRGHVIIEQVLSAPLLPLSSQGASKLVSCPGSFLAEAVSLYLFP